MGYALALRLGLGLWLRVRFCVRFSVWDRLNVVVGLGFRDSLSVSVLLRVRLRVRCGA